MGFSLSFEVTCLWIVAGSTGMVAQYFDVGFWKVYRCNASSNDVCIIAYENSTRLILGYVAGNMYWCWGEVIFWFTFCLTFLSCSWWFQKKFLYFISLSKSFSPNHIDIYNSIGLLFHLIWSTSSWSFVVFITKFWMSQADAEVFVDSLTEFQQIVMPNIWSSEIQ